jgi:predicted O-methyltransferase YrrM
VQNLSERLEAIDRVVADRPQVHSSEQSGQAPGGVWSADVDCYRFLAEWSRPGSRTLETGLGISTVLFAAWGTQHTCIVPYQAEADRCIEYCKARGIPTADLDFRVEPSDVALPTMGREPLDVVFVDGGHGFPTAIIDWYYAAARLERDGILVIDDVNLVSVRQGLIDYLDRDPRWHGLVTTEKWMAYQRKSSGPLAEEWTAQQFLDTESVQ